MKVYEAHNYDGVNRTMVAAATLKAAAQCMSTTAHHLRQYGWSHPKPEEAAIALTDPGTVFYQPIDARYGTHPWRKKRWRRALQGGWC